jgi:hypothetical protein
LFSFVQKCSWAKEPCKECAGQVKSQGRETKRIVERLLLQVCVGSKEIQHLEVSESCRKECAQEYFLRLGVIRKLRKDKTFEFVEGQRREVATERIWKVLQVCVQVDEFREGTLGHSQESSRKNGRSKFSEEISRSSMSH